MVTSELPEKVVLGVGVLFIIGFFFFFFCKKEIIVLYGLVRSLGHIKKV